VNVALSFAGTLSVCLAKTPSVMKNPAASSGYREHFIIIFPKVVTPECSYRGASPRFALIPAKNMRE
jgi:hypothetical protein